MGTTAADEFSAFNDQMDLLSRSLRGGRSGLGRGPSGLDRTCGESRRGRQICGGRWSGIHCSKDSGGFSSNHGGGQRINARHGGKPARSHCDGARCDRGL